MLLSRITYFTVLLLFVAGCSADLASYRALAVEGSAVSSELTSQATSVRKAVHDRQEYIAFRKAYLGGPGNSAVAWKDVAAYAALRVAAAKNLRATYSSFAALADYDASGAFGTATGGLLTSINGLRPEKAIIAEPVQKLIGTVVSEIATASQVRRLRLASEGLVPLLSDYQTYLKEDRAANLIVLRQGVRAKFELSRVLWNNNLADARALVSQFALAEGLVLAPGVGKSAKDARLRKAVAELLDRRREAADSAVAAAYDEEAEALGALIQAHKDLLEDRTPALEEIRAVVARLTVITDELNAIFATPKK